MFGFQKRSRFPPVPLRESQLFFSGKGLKVVSRGVSDIYLRENSARCTIREKEAAVHRPLFPSLGDLSDSPRILMQLAKGERHALVGLACLLSVRACCGLDGTSCGSNRLLEKR